MLKGSNKVGKWKSCHQEREIEHFEVTTAKPLWSHAQGIGRQKITKKSGSPLYCNKGVSPTLSNSKLGAKCKVGYSEEQPWYTSGRQ
jgi:hypothetical protein